MAHMISHESLGFRAPLKGMYRLPLKGLGVIYGKFRVVVMIIRATSIPNEP